MVGILALSALHGDGKATRSAAIDGANNSVLEASHAHTLLYVS